MSISVSTKFILKKNGRGFRYNTRQFSKFTQLDLDRWLKIYAKFIKTLRLSVKLLRL